MVPVSVFVKNEDLVGSFVSEDHVLVKDIAHPHQFVLNCICLDLLDVVDVDQEPLWSGSHRLLDEHDLLSVRPQLCVPAEVGPLSPSPWHKSE